MGSSSSSALLTPGAIRRGDLLPAQGLTVGLHCGHNEDVSREQQGSTDEHRYTEDMQVFLLENSGFRVTASTSQGLADEWHRIFSELVKSGYMRRSQTGRYVWNKMVCFVRPAGPGCMQWFVTDSLAKTGTPPLAAGAVHYPAQCTQDEINEAAAEAERRAHSSRQQLGARKAA
jgi:hypothetical protein